MKVLSSLKSAKERHPDCQIARPSFLSLKVCFQRVVWTHRIRILQKHL